MRVAIFTDHDFHRINGLTTTLTALLDHVPADVSPRIYTAATLGVDTPHCLALPSAAVPIPFCPEMRMYLPRLGEYLRRVVRDNVEVLHLTTLGPMGLTAYWIAARTGLPLVGSCHTDLATRAAILSGCETVGAWRTARWCCCL